ncbi:hypothetical protein QUF54_00280 [Candidatus Marithioploca araucensis]|uniref:Tetratricopeptide repeat protein n=1 Tax=Candidatus Marithioploca araucensis TaxID=70273 RepID=A0ABT7VQ35_9GAMM|nr:hypothetical protein [Candidatus Marithioploca araucensis]
MNPESWLKQLCYIANRNLSQKEWREYMGERPHEKTCPDLPQDTLGALQHIEQGEKLARDGKIDAAEKEFKEAQKLDARYMTVEPQTKAKQIFAPVLVEQGQELAREGKIDAAVMKFKEAQKLDARYMTVEPQTKAKQIFAPVLVEQGQELAREGKIDAAVIKFKEAQKLDARYMTVEPQTKAKQIFAPVLVVEQGQELAKKGEIEKAIAKFKEAQVLDSNLTFDPETKAKQIFAPVLIEQGQELAEKGKFTTAIAKYQEAQQMDSNLEIKPIWASAILKQGQELAKKRKITAAIAKYQEAQQMDSNLKISAWDWNQLCWYGRLSGHAAKVMEYCEKAVELAPKNWKMRSSRALAKTVTGNIQGAIKDFQFAIEKSDDNKWKQEMQGLLDALRRGENPLLATVLVSQGETLAREGKITAAIDKYQKAQQMDSNLKISAENWNQLCWHGRLSGHAAKVMEYCEKAVELAPKNWRMRSNRALAKTVTGNIQGAIKDFQFAIEKSDDNKWKQEMQGLLDALRRGENPLLATVLVDQGTTLVGKGKIIAAIGKYQEAQQMDSNLKISAENWNNLCWNGRLFGHAAKVMEYCEKAVELAPKNWKMRSSRALAKTVTGNIQGAIEDFQFAIEKSDDNKWKQEMQGLLDALRKGENPLLASVLVNQGKILAGKGKIIAAIDKYQEAQQMDPNLKISAEGWNWLCYGGSLYGHAAKVMNSCEKAVALAPENWGIRDSRALARALTGNIQGAIEDLQFVIEKSDDEEYKSKRQGWLDSLQKGENPFTEEVLKKLR